MREGGGVGFFRWNYREAGEFVDTTRNDDIFSNDYQSDGPAIGPVLVAGLRFPLGDAVTAGGEVRWQHAVGDTGGIDAGFLGDKIDLSGTTINFTLHFRF